MSSDRVVLPTNVTPSHYKLELSPNLETLTFGCNEEIAVTVHTETCQVSLHSKEIQIKEASFKSASGISRAVVEISYNWKANTVTFTFEESLPVGEGSISIAYDGILNGDMAGFYKSSYADADGNKKIMASTQFEALDARRAFPCWDEPAMKATFTVVMIVSSHLTALSNMPEIECQYLPKGKKRVTFAVSPKMSTYLLAFAVGEFDMVQAVTKNNVTVRIFSPPGRAEQGQFALDAGVRSLEFYDDFFQVPYPLPKLDMLCVTEFAMGAMENWGLVTYRENALMIDAAKASSQAKERVALVVAHELAHQWFGNLVTMQWWDALWLNEGFANFMEYLCLDTLYPEYKIWEKFTTDSLGAAQRLDSLRSSHPIIVPIKHAEEVEQVFDAISYCKGSAVVNMVYRTLGFDKFRAGLQLYMSRHAYSNTETNDLWAAWTEVSGVDVAELMNTWTTRMGYPFLTVVSEAWSEASVEITLKQAWFLADGSVSPEDSVNPPVWRIPLMFGTAGCTSDTAVIMDKIEQSFTIPLTAGANDWLLINAGQKSLLRVLHSSQMMQRLSPAIRSSAVGSVDRVGLLLDTYALAKAGSASVEAVIEILRALADEDSAVVWSSIQGVVNGLYLMLEEIGGDAFACFAAFIKGMVVKALAKVGWDAKETDGHTEKILRATIISLLDVFAWNDADVVAEARRRFEGHFENPALLPGEYKITVYKIVLMNGGVSEYERVLKTYYETEDNQEKKYAVHSLGAASSIALKTRTMDWAVLSGDVKMQDFFYPIGAVAGNPAGAALAWTYFQSHFQTFKDKLAKASPSLMDACIFNSTSRFVSSARAHEIEAFFKANPLPSSNRRIAQILENMRTNALLLERVRASALVTVQFWQR